MDLTCGISLPCTYCTKKACFVRFYYWQGTNNEKFLWQLFLCVPTVLHSMYIEVLRGQKIKLILLLFFQIFVLTIKSVVHVILSRFYPDFILIFEKIWIK